MRFMVEEFVLGGGGRGLKFVKAIATSSILT